MSKYIDSAFSCLKEYVPGEQPKDKKYIKLNTNESPYPPSPSVIKAVNSAEVADLRLYSDPESSKLKKAIAEVYGVDSKNVFVSNGSDEILNFAFMLYGNVSGALFPEISYGFYKVFCDLYGIDKTMVPLEDDFTINKSKYMSTGKFTVIANPNAPTGIEMNKEDIEEIIASNKNNVVLIDEAYIDFGGTSCYELIRKYDNLIVCRTFSKAYSLAGARLGYCFANEELIKDLEKIKYSTNPYNINRLTQAAGVAAMAENDYYMANCKKIADTREYTTLKLRSLGFEVLDSKTNFIFAKHECISGMDIYTLLRERGILVRHFTDERIKDYNRITIGSREEMEALVNAVKEIVKGA
ncbi:MAG: histidinol-phosphate transaminase [Clostridia bacterium]|nr:histidinol-phosphate transaminase [Clostridia bacterium]